VDEEHNVDAQFVETASIRWEDVEISIDGAETENDLLERIGDTQSHLREKSRTGGSLSPQTHWKRWCSRTLIREGTIPQILQWFRIMKEERKILFSLNGLLTGPSHLSTESRLQKS
jgi:hypothetical protein